MTCGFPPGGCPPGEKGGEAVFTVVIQSQETARLGMDHRRLFFDEPVAQGEMDFCTWIKAGDTVDTAVPALYELVAGKREWRAIVVQTERDRASAPESKPANPFDYLINRDRDVHTVKESTVPLIRLVQMLGGVPKPELDFYQEPVTDEETGSVVRMVYRPAIHPGADEAYRELTEKYQFIENRPKEIIVISTRRPVDNTEQQIEAAWNMRLESESSEFWYRNCYPSLCRFIVFDVLDERHSLYGGCMFRLWQLVGLLAMNQISPSSLQAYRLYRADISLDSKKLLSAFTDYRERMLTMQAQLDAAEANQESLEYEAEKTAPRIEEDIDVVFSAKNSGTLFIDSQGLGLVTDEPEDERGRWDDAFRRASAAMREFMRSPMRALDVAADDTRRKSVYPPEQVSILNTYQRADLDEEIEEHYFNVLEARSLLSFNAEKREEERQIIDRQVRRRIGQRLTKKRALAGYCVGLGVVLAGLIPYMVYAAQRGGAADFLWALLLSIAAAAAVGCFGLAEMWIQRREMADTMEDYNRCVQDTVREMRDSAQHYSDYLSALCIYMKCRSYLDREQELKNGRANVRQLCIGHRRAIKKCLGLIQTWGEALGALPDSGVNVERSYSFDPAVPPEENPAYRFESPGLLNQIPLNATGEELNSPYDFIMGMTLEREELYENVDGTKPH